MKSKRLLVYPGVVLTMIFWGLSYVWLKMVYRFIGPITTTFLRMAATSFLLAVIAASTRNRQKIQPQDWKFVILLSSFHPFLYFCLKVSALNWCPLPWRR